MEMCLFPRDDAEPNGTHSDGTIGHLSISDLRSDLDAEPE